MEVSDLGQGPEGEHSRVLSEPSLMHPPGDTCRSTGSPPPQIGPLRAPAAAATYRVKEDIVPSGKENNVQWLRNEGSIPPQDENTVSESARVAHFCRLLIADAMSAEYDRF